MHPNNYQHIKNQNIVYYNDIAADYDQILNGDVKNEMIRKKVADRLAAVVKKGIVLDFGGGTGLDLKWLSETGYTIIFCEPSSAMRQIAIERFNSQFPDANITFLKDSETDFMSWNEKLPFEEKANGVIANFAVLNCILNIDAFFKNLSLITRSDADVLLLVLNYGIKKRLSINFIEAVKSIFTGKCMNIRTAFNDNNQLVYLHSIQSIKKTAADYFEFKGFESLKEDGFSLIHLIRK